MGEGIRGEIRQRMAALQAAKTLADGAGKALDASKAKPTNTEGPVIHTKGGPLDGGLSEVDRVVSNEGNILDRLHEREM